MVHTGHTEGMTPLDKPEIEVRLLALAARALQNRYLSHLPQAAADPQRAYAALGTWGGFPDRRLTDGRKPSILASPKRMILWDNNIAVEEA